MAALVLALLLLSACAYRKPAILVHRSPADQAAAVELLSPPKIDPMADVPGDRPLPRLKGATERVDCMNGETDLHARIAFEARGGQVLSFAYYSKCKPRTCSLHFARNAPDSK